MEKARPHLDCSYNSVRNKYIGNDTVNAGEYALAATQDGTWRLQVFRMLKSPTVALHSTENSVYEGSRYTRTLMCRR